MYRKQFMNNSNFFPHSQTGVTLLLSIIVLASITAISFSIATIMLVEIRTSGDLLKTEPAISAAEALGEEALFKIKRNLSSYTYSTQVGNASVSTPTESFYNDPVQQDKVLASSYSFANTTNHYTIYDPLDILGGSGYSKLRLTYIDTGNSSNLSAYICQYDPLNSTIDGDITPVCSDPSVSNSYWLLGGNNVTITPLTDLPNREWNLDPSKQQELILINSGGSGTIYVQIETFVPDSLADADTLPDPKGIAFFGERAVEITGNAPGVARKVRILVPNTSSISQEAEFDYSRTISFDYTKVPNTDLTNFPALVTITDPSLRTVANGGHVENASGYDIVFSSDALGSTFLNWEMVSYNASTGSIVAWVQVPTLSHTSNTVIYMFYGNNNVATFLSPAIPWGSNYKTVYHLNQRPNGSAPQLNDSSSSGKHLTSAGSMTGSDLVSGKVDSAIDYDGSNDTTSNTTLSGITNYPITFSAWTLANVGNNSSFRNVIGIGIDSTHYWSIGWANTTAVPILAGSNTTFDSISCAARGTGNWTYIVGVFNSANDRKLYVNGGTSCATDNSSVSAFTPTRVNVVGTFGAGFAFTKVDEARVLTTTLSPDWIQTEYNNQNSPATFYSVGAEQ